MLFNSLEFVVFFVIVYACYLFLPHRWQNRLLIVASCVFYATWNWKFLPLMFLSITTDFVCSKYMVRTDDKAARKRLLWTSIVVNLGILGFFKYANFFLANIHAPLLKIILPLGISFYTFEAISYTVDVYRGVTKPAKKYEDYLLFVIYFPHLIAGPIMRARSFLPQVVTPRVVTWSLVTEGCFLAFWGYFEKMFIADNLAKVVNPIFAGPSYEPGMVLIGAYAFAFQIFCDFDGYSNIARGLGKCMGFDIAINFNLPYFSKNPSEFWKRWHITLSSWLRDYLYIPLGGNRVPGGQVYINLMITMLLGGLWHGAAWTFVVWGAYHGVLLCVHKMIGGDAPKKAVFPGASLVKIFCFFQLTCVGWLLFRARSMAQAWQMLSSLGGPWHWNRDLSYQGISVTLVLLPLVLVQIGQWRTGDLMFLYRQHWLVKTFAYALMAYLILGWGVMRAEEFIYFQF